MNGLRVLTRVASLARILLVTVCFLQLGLGIAVQWLQGPGPDAVLRETPLHDAHRATSQMLLGLAWVAVLTTAPVTGERIGATRRWWWLLHLPLSGLALTLLILSSFTGYLGTPPVTEGSYLRFRVLHTMLVPPLAALCVFAWAWATRSYGRPGGA